MISDIINNLTIVIVTIDRPRSVIRLVRSIIARYPGVKILVGVQSDGCEEASLSNIGADVYRFPFDFGLSATRNAVITHVATKYFLLCDDDFIFDRDTDVAPAVDILNANPEIGIVGGLLYDIDAEDKPNKQTPRTWEKLILLNKEQRAMILVPITSIPVSPTYSGIWRYFITQTVMNFAAMRTDLFHTGVLSWDPRFKIDGEHEDFYLNIMRYAPHVVVAYCPSMFAYHNHSRAHYGPHYESLRDRRDGVRLLAEKWNIDKVVDIWGVVGKVRDGVTLSAYPCPHDFFEFMKLIDGRDGREPRLCESTQTPHAVAAPSADENSMATVPPKSVIVRRARMKIGEVLCTCARMLGANQDEPSSFAWLYRTGTKIWNNAQNGRRAK